MTDSIDLLTRAVALLAEVARVDRSQLTDDDLIRHLKAEEAAGRFMDASRVLSAAEVADRSRYELGAEGLSMRLSERKPDLFVEQVTRVSHAEALRRIRVGSSIRHRLSLQGEALAPERPIVAEAMTNGLIGVDAANAILWSLKQAATGSEATVENMDAAELALTQQATADSADLVLDSGRLWRDALDPEGVEPRYDDIRERRLVTRGRERNGITTFTVKADPVTTAVIDAALLDSMDPKVGPRFLSEQDQARAEVELVDVNGELMEKIVDPRSLGQKQLDILTAVLTAGLRATREGDPALRTVGSVTAIIKLEDLQAGTGFGVLEGSDEVIPASAIREMVCDTGFYLVATGSHGEPLYEGLVQRYFTQAQRRAMIARDGDRCIVPGCKCRAAATHAHHVVFWKDGGSTDIDNGVLLCPAHHHALHQGAFQIRMVDGMPQIRAGIDSWDDSAWRPASRNRLLAAAAL
jgi:Domain of unknown function (DUF222)/HNH endonuclease